MMNYRDNETTSPNLSQWQNSTARLSVFAKQKINLVHCAAISNREFQNAVLTSNAEKKAKEINDVEQAHPGFNVHI